MTNPTLPFSDVLAYLALGRWVQLSRANAERVGKLEGFEVQYMPTMLSTWRAIDWLTYIYKPRMKFRGRKVPA